MEYSNERQYIAEQEALKEQGEQQYNDEQYAKEVRAKDGANWEIPIDGKLVSKKELITAYRFYQHNQIHSGATSCPLCGCDFADNGLFVCDECGQLCNEDERCTEHHDTANVCKDCCSACCEEAEEESAYNALMDKVRGK